MIVSAAAGIAAIGLVYRRLFEPARYVAALAIAAVLAGWALAQWPTILPGLDLRQAAASHDVLVAVIVAVLGGGAIVFPSLAWLFRLSLRGGFDPAAATEQVPSGAPAASRGTGTDHSRRPAGSRRRADRRARAARVRRRARRCTRSAWRP